MHNVVLTANEVSRISLAGDKLHLLDLSGSAALDSQACHDLGLLLQRWRADSAGPAIRKLVLDGLLELTSSIELASLAYGACMPGDETWDVVDNNSQITQSTRRRFTSRATRAVRVTGTTPSAWCR